MGKNTADQPSLEDIGLHEDWQVALYWQLMAQAERCGIDPDDVPALARNLDRIDFGMILADPAEAQEILGVSHAHLDNLTATDPEWMIPLIWARDPKTNRAKFRSWLRVKLVDYRKVRDGFQDRRLLVWRRRRGA